MIDLHGVDISSLNKEEQDTVIKILNEVSTKGSSTTLNNLIQSDYEEVPVGIEEFLHNPLYLGKGLINDEGKYTVYPYWENVLKKIFPDPLKPAQYNTLALTGAIGLGKSFEAVLTGLYELYRMLCLRDPYLYYGLQPIDKISFALLNITMDAAQGVGWDKFQQLAQSSEWFMNHGTVSRGNNPTWSPSKKIELICGSQSRHIIGRAVFWCFADEVSFQNNSDVNKQVEKAKNLVNTAVARMQSRFMKGEHNPCLMVIASSKRTEQSYMETFIESKKQKESKTTLVIDEPQWVIRTDKDSPNKFKVAVGSKFLASEVLPLNVTEEQVNEYRNRGYQIIDVPMGYYETFLDDIDIALTDVAGISTTSSNRYIFGPRIAKIETKRYKNAFSKEIIEVGNAPDDTTQYYDFFDITQIPEDVRHKPLYVHLDMSISGDKTGIGGVFIKGKKPTVQGNPSKDLTFTVGFNVSVKAPKGYQVSFEKNRNFIRWLKEQGFNIRGISSDTYQSYDLLQTLKAEKFNTDVISVDRVVDKVCLPYQYFKNTMYEERMECYESTLLKEEWIGLERDNNTGKIDHSPSSINCFTGDTQISLVDGREMPISKLVEEFNQGKENFVYSFDNENQCIKPKSITNAWCSGKNAKLVCVTLDNGSKVRCTPEHKFMLRDGTYKEAQYLCEGDSLMPLYRKTSDKGLAGYRMYYEPMENSWHYEHRRFATEVFDEKYLVHHKNCNMKDNSPTNLLWMSRAAHQRIHAEIQTGAQSPKAKKKRSESVKLLHRRAKSSQEGWLRYYSGTTEERIKHYETCRERERQKQKDIEDINSYFGIDFNSLSPKLQSRYRGKWSSYKRGNNVSPELGIPLEEAKTQEIQQQIDACNYFGVDINHLDRYKIHSYVMKYIYETREEYKKHIASKVSENHKLGKYKKATEVLANRVWYTNGIDNVYIKNDQVPPEGYHRGRVKTWKNHQVLSVEICEEREDVYDITVEDTHNFALTAGVFVHNSKDSSDAVVGAMYNASQHAEEFAFEYGEDLETILETNEQSTEQNKQQITVDFENELMSAFSLLHTNENTNTSEQVKQMDFGLGPAVSTEDLLINDGIIVI